MPESFEKTEFLDSAYRLVIVAAKRSKELQRGAIPRIEPQNHKSTTVAIREVKENRVKFVIEEEEVEEEA
jgi:DNA-directed RNA polymerase subunit omega